MRRLRRWLFNGLAGLSLLLLLYTTLCWIVAFCTGEHTFGVPIPLSLRNESRMGLYVSRTSLYFGVGRELDQKEYGPWAKWPPSQLQDHSWLGFHYIHGVYVVWGAAGIKWMTRDFEIGIPVVLAIVLAMYCPFFCLRRVIIARHRDKIGACHVCGYDLRATPDRCPECGTVPHQSSTPTNFRKRGTSASDV
jgi:hypothetical protein